MVPDRRGSGGEQRIAHLLLALSDAADVHLIAPAVPSDRAVGGALASVTVVAPEPWALPTGRLRRRMWDVRWATTGPPREVALGAPWRNAVRRVLPDVLDRVRPDVVHVDYAVLAPLVAQRSRRGEPWLLTLHNLGSALARHEAAVTAGRRQHWLLKRDEGKSSRFERWCTEAFATLVTVSAVDALEVPGPAAIVPNGVDCGRTDGTAPPADPVVVFTAALHTAPNVDGIHWFCSEVWPAVVAGRPDARLQIVGSRPPPSVIGLAGDAVTVHADVPETDPFLRGARVAVVPLRLGSGTRIKALEAFAAGRPVVGTTIGLEGLPVRAGHDALVTDDPLGFADAVLTLLDDDDRAAAVGAAGHEVLRRHSLCWADIGPTFARLVLDAVPARPC